MSEWWCKRQWWCSGTGVEVAVQEVIWWCWGEATSVDVISVDGVREALQGDTERRKPLTSEIKAITKLIYLTDGECYWKNAVDGLGDRRESQSCHQTVYKSLFTCGSPTGSHFRYYKDWITVLTTVCVLKMHKRTEIFIEVIIQKKEFAFSSLLKSNKRYIKQTIMLQGFIQDFNDLW